MRALLVCILWHSEGRLDCAWAEPPQVAQLAPGDSVPLPPQLAVAEESIPSPTPPASAESTPADDLHARLAEVLDKRYPEGPADLRVIQQQLQRMLKIVVPATVAVELGEWSGSGVVVTPEGLVLTAGHVVGRPDQQAEFIFPSGRRAKGRMLGINRELDCGMMKITEPAGPWPYAEAAEAGTLRPGNWVIATGQPGGFEPGRTPPVRLGRVLYLDTDMISTDCTLVGGDSGGPLFDMWGHVVGIHSRIGQHTTSNFHVPIAAYHKDWDRLLAGDMWGGPLDADEPFDNWPLLGLAGNSAHDDCRITQVFPNMPAALAGIRVGDVVRTFDTQPVSSFDELTILLLQKRPGEWVAMEIERGDELLTVEVRLGQTLRGLPGGPHEPARRQHEG